MDKKSLRYILPKWCPSQDALSVRRQGNQGKLEPERGWTLLPQAQGGHESHTSSQQRASRHHLGNLTPPMVGVSTLWKTANITNQGLCSQRSSLNIYQHTTDCSHLCKWVGTGCLGATPVHSMEALGDLEYRKYKVPFHK